MRLLASIFVAALASVLVGESLEENSMARNLLNVGWILAPYLVLMTVMVVIDKRTSLMAIAVATLCGSIGALASVAAMTFFEAGTMDRLAPIVQAGAIAVLLPACRWIVARIDANQSPK